MSLNCDEEQWASQITTKGKHFNHPDRLLGFGLYSSGGISAWGLNECMCAAVLTCAAYLLRLQRVSVTATPVSVFLTRRWRNNDSALISMATMRVEASAKIAR